MKKYFAFAIAAATMAVACQKNQDIVTPDTDLVDESDLVEIKFSSNVATVETKISGLNDDGVELYVYGINGTNPTKRPVVNVKATANAAGTNDAPATLALENAHFYDKTGKYSFYGYCLDGLSPTTAFTAENYISPITITGTNDILLAKTTTVSSEILTSKNLTQDDLYSAKSAIAEVHPCLEFKHALSKFTFSAVNLGGSYMSIETITVQTPKTATITVAGASQGVTVGTDAKAENIPLSMKALQLTPTPVSATDVYEYENVLASDADTPAELIVLPGTTYNVILKLTQTAGTTTDTRYITIPSATLLGSETIQAGYAYNFQMKVYSLTEITITATLVDWEEDEIKVDTGDLEESTDDPTVTPSTGA